MITTYLVCSANKLLILHAFNLDINVDAETRHPLRRAEVHSRVDACVCGGVFLAGLGGDELECAEEAGCIPNRSERREKGEGRQRIDSRQRSARSYVYGVCV